MSQFNINNIPLDILKEIIILLDISSLSNIISINQYINQVCDNNFMKDYIIKHYDPIHYKVGKWDNNVFNIPIINYNIDFQSLDNEKCCKNRNENRNEKCNEKYGENRNENYDINSH